MNENNPYSPPGDLAAKPIMPASSAGVGPSERAVAFLSRTRPWTFFIAIMGFIFGGLMGIAAIAMAIAPAVAGGEVGEILVMIGGAAFYMILAALYILFSVYLVRFSSVVKTLEYSLRNEHLEDALSLQHRFWRLAGVSMIVLLGLSILAVIGGIVAAVVMAPGF